MISCCDDCGRNEWEPVNPKQALEKIPQRDRSFFASMLRGGDVQTFACQNCGNVGFSTGPIFEGFGGKHPRRGARQWA